MSLPLFSIVEFMPQAKAGFLGDAEYSGQHKLAIVGPTLYVRIGFDTAYRPGKGLPDVPETLLPALIDTGASRSCIDAALAGDLNLPVVDRRIVVGVHGAKQVDVYHAQIYIPDLDYVLHDQFTVAELTAGGQPHRALIGREFLQNFTMRYEGRTGIVIISS